MSSKKEIHPSIAYLAMKALRCSKLFYPDLSESIPTDSADKCMQGVVSKASRLVRLNFTATMQPRNNNTNSPIVNSSTCASRRSTVSSTSATKQTPRKKRNLSPTPFSSPESSKRKRQCTKQPQCSSPSESLSTLTNTIDDDRHKETYFFLKPSITLNHRRLIPYDIFKLNVGDNIIIVIPIDRPKDTAAVKSVRGGLKRRILKVICDSRRDVLANLNRQQHNFTLDQFLLQYHEVQREGYCYVEFPAVITNYVNRQVYLDGGFNESYIDRLWEQGASVGCTLSNYDSRIMLDIKFSEFAAIELYNQRESNDHYNPKIVFPEKLKQTTGLAEPLREFLHLVHGDVASTYEVLFKFYQSKSSIIQGMLTRERKKNANTQSSTSTETNEETFHQQLEKELSPDKYKAWVEFVDDKYKSAIENHYCDYASITKPLLKTHEITEMYAVMEADFPMHSKAFLNVCVSGRCMDNAWLEIKQRTILHHFLALCRLRNNHKLIHWALVETMANYGSGIPQVSKRSPCNRNFNCDIETAFSHLDRIYESSQKTITDLLNTQNTISVVCDNYQRSIKHNFQVEGKSAIFHRGTCFSLKQDRWFDLPMGTIMMSPNGLRWSVLRCEVVTQYIRSLTIELCCGEFPLLENDAKTEDIQFIGDTIQWPTRLWKIESVPGFETTKEITYLDQHIPTMLHAKVPSSWTENEMIFGLRRIDKTTEQRDFVLMSTNKYHRIIKRTRRFLNFAKYVKYLKNRYYDAPLPAVDLNLCFLFNKCQSQVHQASTCQNWFIKQMNENTDEEDRFIFAGLIPREEVSHAGALQVHTQMNEKLHLLYPTCNYNYTFQHTAKNVRIHQYGDVLSDINFSRIGSHIQKNLSKIGYEDYVKELMSAFDCYTMTHGYFHENMHRVHCIMQESYGGLLQPIQVLWQVKRVGPNVLKNGRLKDHEEFLIKSYVGLDRYRSIMFHEGLSMDDVEPRNNETPYECMLRLDKKYEKYCSDMEKSKNMQTKVIAMFLMKMESYLLCKYAIRKSDPLIAEKEGCEWLSIWKVHGKRNYLDAALRRIETLYYDMDPWMLEVMRRNRFPRLNKGRHALSFDELCEIHNWWLKCLPMTPFLEKLVNRSIHLSLIRRCQIDVWGERKPRSSVKPSYERDIEQLVLFLRTTDAFKEQLESNMTTNTFWDLLKVKIGRTAGSETHASKETVPQTDHEIRLVGAMCTNLQMDMALQCSDNNTDLEDEDDNDIDSVNTAPEHDDVSLSDVLEDDLGQLHDDNDDTTHLNNQENRDEALRHLGNIKHHPIHPNAFQNSFDVGKFLLKKIKSERELHLQKLKRSVEILCMAVEHFSLQTEYRTKIMIEQTQLELSGELGNNVILDDWEQQYIDELSSDN